MGLNLLAIAIFTITLASLLGPLVHLSPGVPALTTGVLLGLITVDTLGWSGQGTSLVVDWFAQRSPAHRDRIIHHEAGHFLVATLLGIPVTGYALSAWEALRQGQQAQGGVQLDDRALEEQWQRGTLSAQWVDRYCQVWLAGAAAERLVYGSVEGAGDDRTKVRTLLTHIQYPRDKFTEKERWAALQAQDLLQRHWDLYGQLVELLRAKAPLEQCQSLFHQPPTQD